MQIEVTPLFEVYVTPLRFYEDLHWYLFLLTEGNPKRICVFMKIGENSVKRLLSIGPLQRQNTTQAQQQVPYPAPSLGTTQHLSTKLPQF